MFVLSYCTEKILLIKEYEIKPIAACEKIKYGEIEVPFRGELNSGGSRIKWLSLIYWKSKFGAQCSVGTTYRSR